MAVLNYGIHRGRLARLFRDQHPHRVSFRRFLVAHPFHVLCERWALRNPQLTGFLALLESTLWRRPNSRHRPGSRHGYAISLEIAAEPKLVMPGLLGGRVVAIRKVLLLHIHFETPQNFQNVSSILFDFGAVLEVAQIGMYRTLRAHDFKLGNAESLCNEGACN